MGSDVSFDSSVIPTRYPNRPTQLHPIPTSGSHRFVSRSSQSNTETTALYGNLANTHIRSKDGDAGLARHAIPARNRALPDFEQTTYEDLTPAVRRTDEI